MSKVKEDRIRSLQGTLNSAYELNAKLLKEIKALKLDNSAQHYEIQDLKDQVSDFVSDFESFAITYQL